MYRAGEGAYFPQVGVNGSVPPDKGGFGCSVGTVQAEMRLFVWAFVGLEAAIMRMDGRWIMAAALAGVLGAISAPAAGQADARVSTPERAPDADWRAAFVPDPNDPAIKAWAARNKERVEMEKQLKRIRAHHFGHMRNVEIRQVGISKLQAFTDPIIYPSLLELFRDEADDVRGAVLDLLADQARDEADATLAWAAIFESDEDFRDLATERLLDRTEAEGDVPYRVKAAIAMGLRSDRDREVAAAAELANVLNLVEAIPMLIHAQAGPTGTASGARSDGGNGALAYIIVGTQQAFVSDLEPVVGENAVAFDPELSVVTEGTVLRVVDAYVITYRTGVHRSLVDLSSRAWGQSTAPLGWGAGAWRAWYKNQFLPTLAKADSSGEPADGAEIPADAQEPAPPGGPGEDPVPDQPS